MYISAAANATVRYIEDFRKGLVGNVCSVNLLPPQLNTELDVYDRRFLLSLAWALVNALVHETSLRTKVLIQGPGKYGAVPLSISGLRRNFEADRAVSAEAWGGEEVMDAKLQVGALEDPEGVNDEDEAIIALAPTNASGMPVINDVMDMVDRVGRSRPIILINPRLSDVPSAAGVMQVHGRAERTDFMSAVSFTFYLRLLFDAGTQYPLRAILCRQYPEPWQLWRPNADDTYNEIAEFDALPTSSEMSDALNSDRRSRQKAEMEDDGLDVLLVENPGVVAVLLAALVLFGVFLQKDALVAFLTSSL